ncbi:uncharacterized protein K444DRAFT_722306 [Hyaloscypha bicolor E]|uniref:DUF6594 domain-containing protein n=1 Tax=Hyaloscypha bicolor E TaxID=1095630 RepID=A0A2J6TB34_9HELO|nr:uncharacterized protein K444DRAFT_722306 [Hyaloscypha bicolor E]PMD60231.1 hypothetical protein K444DRAFT_722306 [Hyaloscypha bicolor E]
MTQLRQAEQLPAAITLGEESSPSPENSGLLSIVKTVLKTVLCLLKLTPSSRPNPEEVQELNKSRGFDKLNYEKVDDYPEGYPQLAAFANSCDTFASVRRFGRLSYRLLAHLQNDLIDMEKVLDKLDKKDAADNTMEKRLRGYENYNGWDDEQRKLDAGLRALGKCPPRNAKALFTWVWDEKPLAIGAGKSDFIFYPDDLVSLAGQSQHDRPFENLVESFLDSYPLPWIKRFLQHDTETRRKTDNEFVHLYSADRLKIVANILEVSVIVILLIPVFLLFLVPMSKPIIATIASLYVTLFSVVVSSLTGAKVQVVFFGSIAYAVIIMFLGNLNSNSSSTGTS